MARLKYSLALPVSLLCLLLALTSVALERGNFTAEYSRQGMSGMRVRMGREAGDGGDMSGKMDDKDVVKSLRLAVFADPTLHHLLATFHPDNPPAATHKFITTIISAAENVLQQALRGSGLQLEVQLVQVGVWAEEKVVPFSGRAMASGTLSGFCQWVSARRPPFEDPAHWHHAMLITGEDVFDSSPSALGATYVGGLCHPQAGCSVVEGHSFRAAYIIAHELAHSLGLPHDGDDISTPDCPAEGHLMGLALTPGSYNWSTCSQKNLAAIVRNHTCLDTIGATKQKDEGMNQDNEQREEIAGQDEMQESAMQGPQRVVPPELDHTAGGLPGKRFSADEQCHFAFGTEYRAVATTTDVCGYLWCTNGMISRGAHPALPGTPCGRSQVCWAGRCEREETVSPPSTAAPPNQPPTSRPTIPPFRPNQPPSRPPYQPPSRPPFRPPSRPPFQPPSRPPFQPPSRPPFQPPSRPPYQPPNRPPFLPPTGQPTRPPHRPSARPPAGRPTLPPYLRPEEKHRFPPATVPDEVSSIPVPLRCQILPPFLHRYIECPSAVINPVSPALPPSPQTPITTEPPTTAIRPQPYLPERDSGNTSAVIKKMETEGADMTFNNSTMPVTSSSVRSSGVVKTLRDNFKVSPNISQTSPPSSLSNTSSVVPSQADFHDSSAGETVEHAARSDEYNINSSANTSHTYELKENNGSDDSSQSHPEGLSDIDEPRKGKKQALSSFNTEEKMKMDENVQLGEKRLNSSDSFITKDIHQILSYIEDQNSSNNSNALDTIMKNKKDEEEKPRNEDKKEKEKNGESVEGQKMRLTEETTDVPLSVRAISISGPNLQNSLHNLIYPLLRWMAREEKEGVKEGEKETLTMEDMERMKDGEKEGVKEKDKDGMKEGEKERQGNQLSSTPANTSAAVNIFTLADRPTISTPAFTYSSQENHLKMQSMFDRLAVVNLREGPAEPLTLAATAPSHTRVSTYAPCTRSCGGGTQLVTQVCVEVTSPEKKVPEEKCDGLPNYRSPYTRPCNTFSCEPPPRWMEGTWGVCSEWCGVGLQQRLVGCVRPLLQELPVPNITLTAVLFLPASACPTPPPVDVRVCEGPCLPVNCSLPDTTFHPACTHLLPDPPLERDHPHTQPSRNFINNFGRQDLYG